MTKPLILVVDDKENMLKLLVRILGDAYDVSTASDGDQAMSALAAQAFDVVVTDFRMPGPDGMEVLKATKTRSPHTEVVMMTAYGAIEHAVEAMKLGAYDYVTKPFDPDDLALVIARAAEQKRWRDQGKTTERISTDRYESPSSIAEPPAEILAGLSYREAVERERERVSRRYLTALLRETHGNVTRAAEQAGMERESLHRLLRRYGVKSEDFKERP